jgi:hypothetical protein
MSDPRYTDPRLRDSVERRDAALGEPWSWIAGIVAFALIGFIVIAGVNHKRNTASSDSSPATIGSAPRNVSPLGTTGSGSSWPQPLMPAPSRSGTQ